MKKTLNLDFVELDRLEANNEVCLMPCPCSSSYSYNSSNNNLSYSGVGGVPCGVAIVGTFLSVYLGRQMDNLSTVVQSFVDDNSIAISDSEAIANGIAEGEAMAAAAAASGGGGK